MTTSQQMHFPTRGGAVSERIVHDKPIPLRLTQSERDEAFKLAGEESRSASNLALHIYRLGMLEHKRRRAAMSAHA